MGARQGQNVQAARKQHDAREHDEAGRRQQRRAEPGAQQRNDAQAQGVEQVVHHARLPDGQQLRGQHALESMRAEGASTHRYHEVQCREYRELPVRHCLSLSVIVCNAAYDMPKSGASRRRARIDRKSP
ncbi:hypothetical protein G6F62_014421 [Rhizopus arrhizus]|nr:hypothetical protein G6F62_014421 [Rhizopus arrhizus]